MMTLEEWQLWVHPYPTLIKTRGRRLNPATFPIGRVFQDGDEMVDLADLFEARKDTPPQLKRCVRAVAKDELKGQESPDKETVRAAVSKGFAICTAQLQKHGYLRLRSQSPTRAGMQSGRSKAAEKSHMDKVSDYEDLLAKARGESAFDDSHEDVLDEGGDQRFEIEHKTSGPNRWWVVEIIKEHPYKRHLRGCKTKTKAMLIKRMFEGDRSAAPEWYRAEIKEAEKQFGNRERAIKYAVGSAQEFGLGPGIVKADPDTGEPL